MRAQKTNSTKTSSIKTLRVSGLEITNKDPDCDYSFRRKREIEEGGGVDQYGYEPVTSENSVGEVRNIPFATAKMKTKTGMIAFHDTVLCKRPKEVSRYFQAIEDEKYNSQKEFVRTAASRAQIKMREIDPSAVIQDHSKGLNFTQRPGPTEEKDGK